jgi:DNA-binding transcriptional regulator GbsR (MarR family)
MAPGERVSGAADGAAGVPSSPDQAGERQFAEEVGRVFEQFGIARMAGRMLGWLLICDPPRQSSADLGTALRASKGAISMATRLLESYGLARRMAVPGERSDFFEMAPDAFTRAHDQVGTSRVFRELMQSGLDLLARQGQQDSPRAERLRETRDLYAFMERELPALMARFRSEYEAARHASDGTGSATDSPTAPSSS